MIGSIGSVVNYCAENPPDSQTLALLAARGDSANVTTCGYSTGSRNLPTGATQESNPVVIPPDPTNYVWNPNVPGMEDCVSLGLSSSAGINCVQRNTQREIDWDYKYGQTQSDYNRAQCLQNAALNNDNGGACFTLWPIGYSGDTPATNVVVPGSGFLQGGGSVIPLVQTPNPNPASTTVPVTKQTVVSKNVVSQTGVTNSTKSTSLPDLSKTLSPLTNVANLTGNEWLLIGGGLLAAMFMFGRGR